ncbi:hypothetical protein HanXRQr2_Chr13g0610621 [Helianthus annuus]|uniref:Uncharacterized protein n=1 Tax=Helianthus annuus TaxID=4232 RepID=A0A9K3EK97_HELAN|nr:hypothetical protein HanXRQr2_Chr13g0610621 [Helianthus annuus]
MISFDPLLGYLFIQKSCSTQCYNGCPNIVDLYSSLAVGEERYIFISSLVGLSVEYGILPLVTNFAAHTQLQVATTHALVCAQAHTHTYARIQIGRVGLPHQHSFFIIFRINVFILYIIIKSLILR